MRWLRLVGPFKKLASFAKEPYKRDLYSAKEPYKRDTILQKRPMFEGRLLTVAHPYHIIAIHTLCALDTLWNEVATISRPPKNIGLFCKRALHKRQYSAKETYVLRKPTNRSHPIWHNRDPHIMRARHIMVYEQAMIRRLLQITGLFCKRALQKRPIFCQRVRCFQGAHSS